LFASHIFDHFFFSSSHSFFFCSDLRIIMLNPHALAQSEGIKMSNLASREVEGTSSSKHRDEADLARLGKRSVLKV
jgi:hypothetical protein